jgi:hypothetical protein
MFRAELTSELLAVSVAFIVLITLVLQRVLPARLSLLIALIKIGIPFAYYAFFITGQWTFLDDQVYLSHAKDLLARGFHPLGSLTDRAFIVRLLFLSQGLHFFYTWWNMFAVWLFGPHYWAPVFLNVLLSAFAVVSFSRLLADWSVPRGYRIAATCFFALDVEVLAWSSILDLKDIVVMTFSVSALRALLLITSGRFAVRSVLVMIASMVILTVTRFYVPAMMLAAAVCMMLVSFNVLRRPGTAFLVLMLCVAVGVSLGKHFVSNLWIVQLQNAGFGLLKFLLTPQPWSLEENYSFLLVPSIVHWATFPLLVFGALRLWRDLPAVRLLTVYCLIMFGVYAVSTMLLGPRERIQLIPILSLFTFHGAYSLLVEYKTWRTRLRSAPQRGEPHISDILPERQGLGSTAA